MREAENQSTQIRRKVRGGTFGESYTVRIQGQAKSQDRDIGR